MPYADLNGLRLYYEVSGAGPPVVFAHGAGGNHLSWWQQVPEFAESYQVITFDHRGFGLTQCRAAAPAPADLIADLLGLLDWLEIERAALIGQSMGGVTVAGLATEYPERVAALVLSASSSGFRPAGNVPSPSQLYAGLNLKNAGPDSGNMPIARSDLAATPEFQASYPARWFLLNQISALNSVAFPDLLPGLGSFQIEPDAIVKSGIPTLVLTGSHDVLVPPVLARGIAKRISGATYAEIPGAGHSAYFEQPAAFNRTVLKFLEAAVF
ncbi:alpha/beta fold hydrolase [bacterium]|nr:alpha/beta fold hydrolase [bacterium]